MKKNVKAPMMKNEIFTRMNLYQKGVISLFEKKCKKSLINKDSYDQLQEMLDGFIHKIFFKNGLYWLKRFSEKFSGLFKGNTNLTEMYMLFMNSYTRSVSSMISQNQSKIDIKEIEKFYEKIDRVNHTFLKYNMPSGHDINKSHLELQQIFDAITDPLFVVDRDMKLIRVNKFLKEKLRVKDYKSILGKDAGGIKFAGEPLCLISDVKEVLSKKRVHVSDIHTKDGKKFYIQYIYPIMDSADVNAKVTSVLVYKKDMSSHKTLEEEIQHLDRLATLGKLSTIVAHEIRNPLSGIGLSASLLKKKLEKDWQYTESLENILEGIDRIETVILRLLDFSKPKKTNIQRINILEPLKESLFFIKSRALKSSIKIIEDHPEQLPKALIDPNQMTQVFINLLLNAIQSMQEPGTITIKITCDKKGIMTLQIKDTGCGIRKKDIPHIFEPFFTTKTDGTGIGLTISNSILKQNNIDISVESKWGVGTTFNLTIKAGHEV